MNDLTSKQALYEKAATLEAQALEYVSRLSERDEGKPRMAFKCKNPKCKAYMAFYNQDAMTSEHGSLMSYNRRTNDE